MRYELPPDVEPCAPAERPDVFIALLIVALVAGAMGFALGALLI